MRFRPPWQILGFPAKFEVTFNASLISCYFPKRPDITPANTKPAMLAPAGAVKDVDVRRRLISLRLESLNLVVLRMPAARRDLLVLLQSFDIFDRYQPAEFGDWIPRTGLNVAHVRVNALAPKSTVNVSPLASVGDDA